MSKGLQKETTACKSTETKIISGHPCDEVKSITISSTTTVYDYRQWLNSLSDDELKELIIMAKEELCRRIQ